MKKILFKFWQFPHLSETFILAQIITAIKAGYDVKILVKEVLDFNNASEELLLKYNIIDRIIHKQELAPKNKYKRSLGAFLLTLKNSVHYRPLLKFLKLKRRFSTAWIYEFEFYKQFRDYEIVHVQYGTNVHPLDLLKESGLLKARIIVSFHGHDAFFPINGFIPNNGYYKYLFRNNNLIVANTPYLADKILQLGCSPSQLITVPVAVDIEYFSPSPKKDYQVNKKFKLLSVGRLDAVKGHHLLIEMTYELIEREYNVELTIVGEGKERKNIESIVKRLKMQEHVTMPGAKSQEEVRKYYRKADIYLLAAVPLSDGRRETQGLATLEAQACGLPVVAFDSGGVKYTVQDGITGYLCPEYDVDCLVEKVILLLDVGRAERMSQKAQNFVEENFSQKVIDNKWKAIYGGTL